ncbi:uncharacterized protein ASPGLDRAFT_700642 [Aspergillus glaucus CBS 516.65]|uniref:Uncharacterized protein n=1 Tax=Aspergillus glaucus CBS 516.65 TaxID=1160497 RepID=A0A1L9VWS5_ASPGL|nr:hypothetical protein ASPGLDRAFT_700642 [Aspergillus glaucus CBS 516.65]OJJ88368.1 hypothetical protein ASPGLDRAFT_700642 [Aspergillus glaucus CBS 516.65]
MSLLKCLPCNLNRFFRRPFTASTRIPSPTTTTSKYAKDQPAGFTNRIEKVAIVGVSQLPLEPILDKP